MDDLLNLLDPAIREGIEGDYDRFAPLLALLQAWQQEVEGHVAQTEQNTVRQLIGELFPKGQWKFPYQALIVPEDLARRDIGADMLFTDRTTQTPWTVCGPGGTLPTRLQRWDVEWQGENRYALWCDIHLESRQSDARLLAPPHPPEDPHGQVQLAFVCAPEPIVAELAAAAWAVQHKGGEFEPVGVTRYQGYLDFEQGVGASRAKQRQLEAWLPPFYPYSRKFLRFYAPAPASEKAQEGSGKTQESSGKSLQDWTWLKNEGATIRLAALISETAFDYLEKHRDTPPLILNAIPVAQMKTMSGEIRKLPDPVGESGKVPFMGYKGCFAATARQVRDDKVTYYPVRLLVTAGEDIRSLTGTQNLDVLCDRPPDTGDGFSVCIHYECYGEQAAPPYALTRPNGTRFSVPFPSEGSMNPLPAVGGMDCLIADYHDAGARRAWYHALLRAPQLTQGDVLEILSQIPACARYLNLNLDPLDPHHVSIQLDMENNPKIERDSWNSYLWPCLVGETPLLEQRATYLTAGKRIAILPVMRLIFHPGQGSLPDFLQEDLVRYAASVISQYFMLGWYRVVGKRADA